MNSRVNVVPSFAPLKEPITLGSGSCLADRLRIKRASSGKNGQMIG
jgi:hypothetical protein